MSDYYLIPELGYKCVGIFYNNASHISSVVIHVGEMVSHTLYPWPCQILFIDMTAMWNHGIIVCFKYITGHFARPSIFCILDLVFLEIG